MEQQKQSIFTVSSGLDDFEEGADGVMESVDFADQLRARIVEECGSAQDIGGFEVSRGGGRKGGREMLVYALKVVLHSIRARGPCNVIF